MATPTPRFENRLDAKATTRRRLKNYAPDALLRLLIMVFVLASNLALLSVVNGFSLQF